jgi:hypothetical protein
MATTTTDHEEPTLGQVNQENEKPVINGHGNDDSNKTPSLSDDEAFTNPTGINEKTLLRRLDLKLLPPLSLLYLLSFLDRSNSM